MGKILVIAEKSKTAKALISGMEERFEFKEKAKMPVGSAKVGYFESPSTIIACARGHLFTLYSIEDYQYGVSDSQHNSPQKNKWTLDILPYVPKQFKLKVTEEKNNFPKKQFEVIRELIHRPDIDYIVHYGDPDNEGELLIREILEQAGNTKEVKRLFTNSLVPSVVAEEFYLNLQNDRDFNDMYLEALARQQTDWLLGINLSRYLSLKANTKFRAGRVIIPIVKYIYDRDMEIKNFSATKSLGINATIQNGDFQRVIYTSKPKIRFEEGQRQECQQLLDKLSSSPMIVESVESSKYKIRPKKFMCLTDFRTEMNQQFGYPIEKSTAIAQALYENGYISYPRTNSQYLSTKEAENVQKIIQMISGAYGIPLQFKQSKNIFDDSKVSNEGHTALTLTTCLPTQKDLLQMGEDCMRGYKLILARFISNFYTQPIVEETVVTMDCAGYKFQISGERVIEKGFLSFEPRDIQETLPVFAVGQVIDATFDIAERETKPPKKVSVKELLEYLKNPYQKELKAMNPNDDTEYYRLLKEGVSLGTEATVDTIIGNAIKEGYITSSKKNYSIGERGIALIHLLDELGINLYKDRNVAMNKAIRAVGTKKITLEENVSSIEEELKTIIENNKEVVINISVPDSGDRKTVATCPLCGGKVRQLKNKDGKVFFACENHQKNSGCKFYFPPGSRYFEALGIKPTSKIIKNIAEDGFFIIKGLTSKKGNKYDAKISVSFPDDKRFPKYDMSYVNAPTRKKKTENNTDEGSDTT